ncbi:hypothetical protein ABS772_07060 [Methylorubrum podarium]|uniref:DUF6894 domain-containing protein n=1 Tax=Methylorubrum podarium TaxID=200476 RepID=A0ABV1QJW3_9HYPH
MPRYFFVVEDGERTVDEEGMELKGPDAAAAAALSILLDVGRFEVIVRDESGKRIYQSNLTIQAGWMAEEAITANAASG